MGPACREANSNEERGRGISLDWMKTGNVAYNVVPIEQIICVAHPRARVSQMEKRFTVDTPLTVLFGLSIFNRLRGCGTSWSRWCVHVLRSYRIFCVEKYFVIMKESSILDVMILGWEA